MPRPLTIKDHIRESHLFNERAALALVVVTVLFFALIIRLFYLQIISHSHFETLSQNNRVTLVPIAPNRGLIYDRNGVVLAQNMPSFSLEMVPEHTPDIEGELKALSDLLAISEDEVQRFKQRLKQSNRFESIPIRFQLNEEEVALFAVNRHNFPGIDIQARLWRNYPLGNLAVHAVGYVGRIDEEETQKLDPANYRGTTHIGKTGVEKSFEEILHGTAGIQQIETNAMGRMLRQIDTTPPRPGHNVILTLDADLQTIAEESLKDKRGAVVAIQPKTGEILVFASMPGYDPNLFVNGVDPETFKALNESRARPLYNRALRGQYPPGSTIKPFVGLAGLEYEEISPQSSTFCRGWYSLKGDTHRYHDWRHEGHGTMTLKSAITQSCDVYFYDLALTLGIDRLHEFLDHFGFGQKTGINIFGEQQGLVPSRQWKMKLRREPFYSGELIITGIGQGYLLVTPLQLAQAVATLANRGARYQPHIVEALQHPETLEKVPLQSVQLENISMVSPENWNTVIEGMTDVVNSPSGTAYSIGRNSPYKIAGKTGTAQVFGLKQNEKYNASRIDEYLRDHALFIAFAPVENPQIAVAVIAENAGHGGSAAAPIAKKIMDRYLLNKLPAKAADKSSSSSGSPAPTGYAE